MPSVVACVTGTLTGAYTPAYVDLAMPNQPKTPNRAIRIPDALWAEARRIATERGETVSAVLVAALARYVQRHGKKETE